MEFHALCEKMKQTNLTREITHKRHTSKRVLCYSHVKRK